MSLNNNNIQQPNTNTSDNNYLINTYLSIRQDILSLLKKITNKLNFKSQTFFLAVTYMDIIIYTMLLQIENKNENYKINYNNNDLYIKALSCLVIASKYQELDYSIPNLRNYIEYYHLYGGKHTPFVTTDQLRQEEVNVLILLKYKLSYYTIYDYITFIFCHGITTQNELLFTENIVALATNDSNDINVIKIKRILEKIYIKARDWLDKIIYMPICFYYMNYNLYFAIYILENCIKEVLLTKINKEDNDNKCELVFKFIMMDVYKNDYYINKDIEEFKEKLNEIKNNKNVKSINNVISKNKTRSLRQSSSLSRMFMSNNHSSYTNIHKIQNNNNNSNDVDNNSTTNIFNNNNDNNSNNNYLALSSNTKPHLKLTDEQTFIQKPNLLDPFNLMPSTFYTRRSVSSFKKQNLIETTYNHSNNTNNNNNHHSVISAQDILNKTKQLFGKTTYKFTSNLKNDNNNNNNNAHNNNGTIIINNININIQKPNRNELLYGDNNSTNNFYNNSARKSNIYNNNTNNINYLHNSGNYISNHSKNYLGSYSLLSTKYKKLYNYY